MNSILFYQDHPIFGLDVGFSSVKVMQIQKHGSSIAISAYGSVPFEPEAIQDGVIVDPEVIAREVKAFFKEKLIGKVDTRRVVLSIPAAYSYIRRMSLPDVREQDIAEAVRLDTEEYVPLLPEDTYMDFEAYDRAEGKDAVTVSASKTLVDSYVALADILGLETVAVETTINAACRLFAASDVNHTPSILIDLGSRSSDITVYDQGIIVTSTVPGGGDSFSEAIAKILSITHKEAHLIKTRYGLGVSKKQREITDALSPILQQLAKEVRRMARYYEERTNKDKKIDQVVIMGGGANMPGLADWLTNTLRLPVRICDPWQDVKSVHKLQLPTNSEKSMYATAFGMALIKPEDIFV
ncbi:type IV pilus assembly protein PilM [Candidatus Saccharibacteria bacterium]|nr:type IV pilus assembly protein PilM [Candidatus Saccharibacteria bacterium]